MKTAIKLGVFGASLAMVVALALPAAAINVNAQQNGNNQTQNQTTQATPNQSQSEKKQAVQAKLTETKMKVCRNREKLVNNIMARIGDRGQKQLELFTTIAEKTQEFYKNKDYSLENYDALVSEVTARQQAAEQTMTAIKAQNANFSCDGSDPKMATNTFKENLKLEIAAMKEYKTAVKNLIVGVKSAAEKASSTTTEVQNAQ